MNSSSPAEIESRYMEFLPGFVTCKNQTVYQQAVPRIRRAWELIRDEAQRTSRGSFVAVAPDKVVGVFLTAEEAEAAVKGLERVPDCYAVFAVDDDSILDFTSQNVSV